MVAAVHVAAIFFLRLHEEASRLFFVSYFVGAFVALAGTRAILRAVAQSTPHRWRNTRVFAVVGSGELANEVVRTVEEHPEWGYQFAGHVLDGAGRRQPRSRSWFSVPSPSSARSSTTTSSTR